MKEYTKAKIVVDIHQDLLQFLDDDELKADALSYLLDPHVKLKTQILIQYGDFLPVSDEKRIQQIRNLFANDFLLKYPHHKEQLEHIYDGNYIAIGEQLAYIISYRIEGYIRHVYEVSVPGSVPGTDEIYNEEKNYLQSLASAVAGTSNAETLVQDDIALVIYESAHIHLSDLAKRGIYPSAPVIIPASASIKRREDNSYAFLLNITSTLSGILSVAAFTATVLAVESIITISTAGVGLVASVGVVTGLVSFGLYSSNKEPTKKENLGDQDIFCAFNKR